MGQDGMIHGSAGRSHTTNQTPHIGIYLVVPLMVIGPFVIIISGHTPIDVINWMGTTATFGFMLAYLLVAIAAPLYLYRRGQGEQRPAPGRVHRAVARPPLHFSIDLLVLPAPAPRPSP